MCGTDSYMMQWTSGWYLNELCDGFLILAELRKNPRRVYVFEKKFKEVKRFLNNSCEKVKR